MHGTNCASHLALHKNVPHQLTMQIRYGAVVKSFFINFLSSKASADPECFYWRISPISAALLPWRAKYKPSGVLWDKVDLWGVPDLLVPGGQQGAQSSLLS